MFVDYLLLVLQILIALAYGVMTILVVCNYSIRFMWQEFWTEQSIVGKISANVFYFPAWIIKFVLVALVVVANFVIVPLYKIFGVLAKWINPIFKRAIKLEL